MFDILKYVLDQCFIIQIDLFDAETEKKESMPNLRICDFLKSEVGSME